MKKIMIAATFVCVAALSQAASTDWSVYMGSDCPLMAASSGDGDEDFGTPIGGTMYLFNAGITDQAAVWAVLNAAESEAGRASALASFAAENGFAQSLTVGSNGSIGAPKTMTNGPTEDTSYFAVIAATDGKYFFDDATEAEGTYNELSGGSIALDPSAWSGDPLFDYGKASAFGETGWYSFGSAPTPTPEPTSGLLLLLGVAGLALKRKRA